MSPPPVRPGPDADADGVTLGPGSWDGPPIRLLTPADRPAFSALSASRDWGPSEVKWDLVLAQSQAHPGVVRAWGVDHPDGSGRLAGSVTLFDHGQGFALLGAMLVAPDVERRGLGARLVRHAVDAAADGAVSLFATRFGRPVYERLGFAEVGQVRVLRGQAGGGRSGGGRPGGGRPGSEGVVIGAPGASAPTSDRAGDRSGEHWTLRGGAALPSSGAHPGRLALAGLRSLDRMATGCDRAVLLDALASRPGAVAAWCGRDPNELGDADSGIVAADGAAGLAWWCGDWWRLGPVVGQDDDAVVAVLDPLVAEVGGRGPVRIDVDVTDRVLERWALDRGLAEDRVAPRMAVGRARWPGPGLRAIATQGWG